MTPLGWAEVALMFGCIAAFVVGALASMSLADERNAERWDRIGHRGVLGIMLLAPVVLTLHWLGHIT